MKENVKDHEIHLNDLDHTPQPVPNNTIKIGPDGLPIDTIDPESAKFGQTDVKNSSNYEIPEHHSEEEDDTEAKLDKVPIVRARRFATIVNLLNSLLGAGILGVPNSFTNLGIIPSIAMLIIMAILSYIGTVMTIKLQHDLNADGFADLAFHLMGRAGDVALAIMSLFFLVSCQLSYLVLGSDMIISWFAIGGIDMTPMFRRAILVLVYALCIPIALSLPKNKPYLKYISTSTAVFILFFDIAILVKGCISLHDHGIESTVTLAKIDINIFSSLSIYALAFALPVVVLPVITQYNIDLHKRNVASGFTVFICFILVFIPGLFGYFQFGSSTLPNITQNYDDKDFLIIVVRAAFVFVVSFAYVSISNNTLISWSEIIFKDSQPHQMKLWKRIACLIITNIIPLLIAMFLANAKPALNIGGAMGGCMSDYFFPAIMWIIHSEHRWYHWQNLLCILFAAFGLVTAVISTYQAVLDAIDAFSNLK